MVEIRSYRFVDGAVGVKVVVILIDKSEVFAVVDVVDGFVIFVGGEVFKHEVFSFGILRNSERSGVCGDGTYRKVRAERNGFFRACGYACEVLVVLIVERNVYFKVGRTVFVVINRSTRRLVLSLLGLQEEFVLAVRYVDFRYEVRFDKQVVVFELNFDLARFFEAFNRIGFVKQSEHIVDRVVRDNSFARGAYGVVLEVVVFRSAVYSVEFCHVFDFQHVAASELRGSGDVEYVVGVRFPYYVGHKFAGTGIERTVA